MEAGKMGLEITVAQGKRVQGLRQSATAHDQSRIQASKFSSVIGNDWRPLLYPSKRDISYAGHTYSSPTLQLIPYLCHPVFCHCDKAPSVINLSILLLFDSIALSLWQCRTSWWVQLDRPAHLMAAGMQRETKSHQGPNTSFMGICLSDLTPFHWGPLPKVLPPHSSEELATMPLIHRPLGASQTQTVTLASALAQYTSSILLCSTVNLTSLPLGVTD